MTIRVFLLFLATGQNELLHSKRSSLHPERRRAMAVTDRKRFGQDLLTPDELMDGLEEIRAEYGGLHREKDKPQTVEAIAAQKRRIHRGGDGNHRFEGERYLAITDDKAARRMQLRKLVDEGGQDSVGGPMPSHPTLQKWHSLEFGLTEEEVHDLEMQDFTPEALTYFGWYYWMHRSEEWPVLLGSAMVGEGEKRVPEARERMIRELDAARELYQQLGIKNVDRAMQNQLEHSPIGADDEHVIFGENMTREHVNTPELQDALRKAFILRLHQPRA
jgi:pyrroloquinoline quinone (PQQ) biosynthesis protein C